jgi:hypothetical protein
VDSLRVKQEAFQFSDGGATPTSTLQLHLKLIRSQLALNIYAQWHYLGSTSFIGSIHFGVWFEGQWLGAISYGPPSAMDFDPYWTRTTQAGWWDIKRLALSPRCPKNSESRIIAISIRLLRGMELVRGIITYADTAQNHEGIIYKAAGFQALGLSDQKCDYVIDGSVQQRGSVKGKNGQWIPRSRKFVFIKYFTSRLPLGQEGA